LIASPFPSPQVPTDVDFRILLTFLELHQTLLGFVLFKLYTDINLVYPPPLDQSKDDAGAGYGAFVLTEKPKTISSAPEGVEEAAAGSKKKVTTRDVKKGIKSIVASGAGEGMDVDEAAPAPSSVTVEDITDQADDFVEQPSKSADPTASSTLPTFSSLSASSGSNSLTTLFSPYTFYISRSVPRSTAEFILRSFGAARIGWEESSLGLGADFSSPSDPSITHIIVDRPASATGAFVWSEGGLKEGDEDKRAYVQPQWIVDCANEGRLLPTDEYKPGAVLPPHLSPFGSNESRGFASDSRNAGTEGAGSGVLDEETAAADEEESDSDEDDDEEEAAADDNMDSPSTLPPALLASSLDPTNPLLLHSAELEAETLGTPLATFEADLAKATKEAVKSGKSKAKGKGSSAGVKAEEDDEDLRKIMMSNKQKKLYEKMK
jgi:pescadillo protein